MINFSTDELKEELMDSDILINATSAGMCPKVDCSPIPKEALQPGLVVMDIVYNPLETRLLRDARDLGCKTIDGIDMLVNQGAESLKIWLGINAPIDLMRKTVKDNLKNI